MKTKIFYTLLMFLLFLPLTALAIPQLVNYQGRLTDGTGAPVTGSKSIAFKIYTSASSPGSIWAETQAVTVTNGIFNVLLGSASSLSGTVFGGDKAYLGVTVSPDAEMSPRQRITSVGYAYRAAQAEGVISPLKVLYGGTTSPAGYFGATNSGNPNPAVFANTTGLGNAGKFTSTNFSNPTPALYTETRGTGQALYAKHSGPEGQAAHFEISSPDNSYEAIMAETVGNGSAALYAYSAGNNGFGVVGKSVGPGTYGFQSSAGYFGVENMTSNATAITARSGGIGDTAYFDSNTYNPADVVHAVSSGTATANAGHFEVQYMNSPATALFANTTGLGGAGKFMSTNSLNSTPALYTETRGTGQALYVKNSGTGGQGAHFEISSPDNSYEALMAETVGTGSSAIYAYAAGNNGFGVASQVVGPGTYGFQSSAGYFTVGNAESNATAITARSGGIGDTAYFDSNTYNPADVVHAISSGTATATAGHFEIQYKNSPATALFANTTGLGYAGRFKISNNTNSSDALYATTNGSGYAGNFQGKVNVSGNLTVGGTITGNGSGLTNLPAGNLTGAISVNQAAASGRAGSFTITNASNGSEALYATTTGNGRAVYAYTSGTGYAGLFQINNASSGSYAVYGSTNGTGAAVGGTTTGSGYGITGQSGGTGPGVFGYSNGTGNAGYFQIGNSGNSADALYATTIGTGYAGNFQGKVNVSGNLAVGGTISGNGSSITNIPATQGGIVYAALANGSTAMALGTNTCVRVTPTATATYTTTVPAAGVQCTVIILTSGTNTYTIAFGTGFRANGTIATGTTTARYHTVTFISDGTNLIEIGRATAASGI